MSLTPEAKSLLAETIRGTAQDPERGIRARLLRAIHDEADRRYRLSVAIEDAGLDEAHRRRRERIEAWIEEQTRATKPKNKADEKATKVRLLAQAEKEAAATLINRAIVLRQLEALGLSRPAVLTGGWTSKGYREFQEFGRTLCSNGTADATEGYGTLLQLLFDELAIDLPGLFGDVGLSRLFAIPPATLRDVIEKLDDPELASAWNDETTLGWVYQYWNDPDREALDAKINPKTAWGSGKIEPHEIASKTQMFTERYMVEWLLQNSLGLTWLCMCKRHGWTAEAEKVLPVLDARRADWRQRREAGEVDLDALMPIEGELEEQWKYYVLQPLPDDAIKNAPDSVRTLKLLDPAVGSGHFLVIAFGLLTALYREEARHRGQTISDREIAESIIENNLHGIDIDPRAIQIAAAGLYLKTKSLARDAHPKRMNLVAPVLQLGNLPKDDPAVATLRADLKRDVGIPEALTNRLLDALAGVDYLGSLLKVDAAIEDAIRTVELSFDEQPARRSRSGLSGSLATAKESLLDKLETFLSRHSTSEDLGLRLDGEQLAAGVRFVRMVREGTYDVVAGNPPYHGVNKLLDSEYYVANYPEGRQDLLSGFFLRSISLLRAGGHCGLITLSNWMFLSSYQDFRSAILANTIVDVADLGKAAFTTGGTLISTACAVIRRGKGSSMAIAIRPHAPDEVVRDDGQPLRTRAALLLQRGRYEFDPRGFSVIEGEPIVYWWSKQFLERYASAPKLGDVSPAKFGLNTGNNVRFLRRPWELHASVITSAKVGDPLPSRCSIRWSRFLKGAGGRAWIDPCDDAIQWSNNGLEVKVLAEHLYGSYTRQIRNERMYWQPGVAFTMIGSAFSARVHRFRCVIDSKGSSVYPLEPLTTSDCVCLMNRAESRDVLASLNPTVSFQVGDVNRLPVLPVAEAGAIVGHLDSAFGAHEAGREPSSEFRRPTPSSWRYFQTWAQGAVDRPPGAALPSIESVPDEPSLESLVSFAVGVVLGRFDANGEGVITSPPPTSLPAGTLFVTSAGDDSLDVPAARPLVSAWSTHGDAVGGGADLRTYLRISFFGYHKKVYENRPIYLPLSSARKSFVAFISIHRWQADTLKTLLADHLVPTKRKLDGELDDLRAARATGANKRHAERRFTEVQRLVEELSEFIGKVNEIADCGPPPPDDNTPRRELDEQFILDLDDGVMVNSAALWPLLEPQWKEPKKWWKQLATAKGKKDFDWSHLAARYFPTRARKKCHHDPSLAVAHKCFWAMHPAKAYAWELRFKDEIRPEFTIDEPDSDDARTKFLAEHERDAAEIHADEMRRRARKAAKAEDDSESGPLFEQAEDDEAEEPSDD